MSAPTSKSEVTRLFPPAADAARLGSRAAYAQLEFGADAPRDRPYVIVNMVATVDGQSRVGKDTAQLGGDADGDLFATLRERVDCVMAGIGTIGAENYSAPARTPDVQERRVAAGLNARPIVATVTRRGQLPATAPLFADAGIRIVVFSEASLDEDGVEAELIQAHTTDPAEVLMTLRRQENVRSLLLEGGPHLNTDFFAAGLVDELFLTVAPLLTGNADPFPIIAGPLPARRQLQLVGALAGDGELFLRYQVG